MIENCLLRLESYRSKPVVIEAGENSATSALAESEETVTYEAEQQVVKKGKKRKANTLSIVSSPKRRRGNPVITNKYDR